MVDEDYVEGDRWDWDQSDPRQYCKHGTFIGSWWGPDILCGACECGDPDPTMREVKAAKAAKVEMWKVRWTKLGECIVWMTSDETAQLVEFVKMLQDRQQRELAEFDRQLEEMAGWVRSEDDDNWLGRRRSGMIRSYELMREND